ncbi:MAG: carbohydrate binding domain-containing protein [Lachnospiraceae bacterium]|nr:carbohydrate binding domain-containing protein [Lachnospiraceae bacterium]
MQKHTRTGLAMLLSLAMILAAMAPATTVQAAQKKAKKKIISVTVTNVKDSKVSLKKGKTFKIKATVKKTGKISKKLIYKSSNPKVAKISGSKIKALKNGKSTITVKSKADPKKKVKFTVVVGTPVKSVKLDKTSYTGKVGETFSLKAVVSPASASVKTVAFSSDNEKVATVDKNGKVTLVAEGSVSVTAASTDNTGKKAVCKVTVEKEAAPVEPAKPAEPAEEGPKLKDATKLSREGYTLQWQDEFNGENLDTSVWNVEVRPKGYYNAELQSYVNSSDNIYVRDGKLYLVPIANTEGETTTYTSGRIHTQGNKDFKYGLFEARIKTPKGKGYLPAFWMMPTDEDYYGQWPKCGEIDIMEVLGELPDTLWGTIHYGKSKDLQGSKQGKGILEEGKYLHVDTDTKVLDGYYAAVNGKDYTEDFHDYAVEWEPGHISWYVDGIKYYEADDWYSGVENGPDYSYPAPFDQPFYVILNLAVGGDWPCDPDESTPFGEDGALVVESVSVSQKDASYYAQLEETCEKPEKVEVVREPDANGNYIVNGDFARTINAATDWDMNLADNAASSTYVVKNNAITITPAGVGEKNYSLQLKQPGVPLKRGVEYTLTYDAYATEARTMIVDVEGPSVGYTRYFNDTEVNLTTTKQTFTHTFTMNKAADNNACVEFNLGNQNSLAPVTISNVSLKETGGTAINEEDYRTVRADGNYLYNGTFSEGDKRLGYWEIDEADKAAVSVTNINNVRRLKVVAPEGTSDTNPVVVKQSKVAIGTDTFALSFKAETDSAESKEGLTVTLSGNSASHSETPILPVDSETEYTYRFDYEGNKNEVFTLSFTKPGTYYVDDIMLTENALIKNGFFSSGMAGFSTYVDSQASASYGVDELSHPEKAFTMTINNTGTEAYHIQLIQDNVPLEKDHYYRLSLKAKSDMNRAINFKMSHNGGVDGIWDVYSETARADLTADYQTFTTYFKMTAASDPKARLSIELGKVGEVITSRHEVCIDDIELVEINESEMPATSANLLTNPSFANDASGWIKYGQDDTGITVSENSVTFVIGTEGIADGDTEDSIALAQDIPTLEAGKTYKFSFKASSTADRTITAMISKTVANWDEYAGNRNVALTSELNDYEFTFTPANDVTVDDSVRLAFKLGRITKYLAENDYQASTYDTPSSTIVIKDVSLVEVQ